MILTRQSQVQVFLLKAVHLAQRKMADNSIHAYEVEVGVFDSVEKAEAAILGFVKDMEYDSLFGFFLYEKTLNDGVRERKWLRGVNTLICQYQSVRSYLADGRLLCYSPYDDCCVKEFRGRDRTTINSRIKEGGLAFQWCGDKIYPCIIASLPPSGEDWRRMKERVVRRAGRWSRSYGWDSSDDCYCVYEYDKGHAHPATWRVFPFFGTISKRNLDRLRKSKEWYEAGCEGK